MSKTCYKDIIKSYKTCIYFNTYTKTTTSIIFKKIMYIFINAYLLWISTGDVELLPCLLDLNLIYRNIYFNNQFFLIKVFLTHSDISS